MRATIWLLDYRELARVTVRMLEKQGSMGTANNLLDCKELMTAIIR